MKYVQSPLRYPGSKGRVLSKIIPYIVEARKYCNEYREPFVGGGSVFLNSGFWDLKWVNDIDPGIAALYRIIRDEPDQLVKLVKETIPTVDLWEKIRYSHPQTELELAFKVLFLNRTNYSGIIGANPIGGFGQKSKYPIYCRWNPETIISRLYKMSKELQNVIITSDDFFFVVNKPSNRRVFLLLDPPYYEMGNQLYDYGMSSGDHERLRELLRSTEHLFLLTYDNCSQVWGLYRDVPGLYFYTSEWKYTTNTFSSKGCKVGRELFISNFPVPSLKLKTVDELDEEEVAISYEC